MIEDFIWEKVMPVILVMLLAFALLLAVWITLLITGGIDAPGTGECAVEVVE